MKEGTAPKLTAADVRALLEVRYAMPEWHCDHELTHRGRRLDALAFRLWGGGKGYRVLGFEIKTSRGDWRHELTQIEKSREWAEVVDEFYVVAPAGIVQLDELPRGWGLLEVRKSKLFLRAHPQSKPVRAELHKEVVARLVLHVTAKLSADRHAVRSSMEATVRADLTARVTARLERKYAEQAEKVTAYDVLMNAAGLGEYDDPTEILATARRLVTAANSLPQEWQMKLAVESIQKISAAVEKSMSQLEEALVGFEALNDARKVP